MSTQVKQATSIHKRRHIMLQRASPTMKLTAILETCAAHNMQVNQINMKAWSRASVIIQRTFLPLCAGRAEHFR